MGIASGRGPLIHRSFALHVTQAALTVPAWSTVGEAIYAREASSPPERAAVAFVVYLQSLFQGDTVTEGATSAAVAQKAPHLLLQPHEYWGLCYATDGRQTVVSYQPANGCSTGYLTPAAA